MAPSARPKRFTKSLLNSFATRPCDLHWVIWHSVTATNLFLTPPLTFPLVCVYPRHCLSNRGPVPSTRMTGHRNLWREPLRVPPLVTHVGRGPAYAQRVYLFFAEPTEPESTMALLSHSTVGRFKTFKGVWAGDSLFRCCVRRSHGTQRGWARGNTKIIQSSVLTPFYCFLV